MEVDPLAFGIPNMSCYGHGKQRSQKPRSQEAAQEEDTCCRHQKSDSRGFQSSRFQGRARDDSTFRIIGRSVSLVDCFWRVAQASAAPGMTLSQGQLDQAKISVTDFRAETTTLNAREKMKLRKLCSLQMRANARRSWRTPDQATSVSQ